MNKREDQKSNKKRRRKYEKNQLKNDTDNPQNGGEQGDNMRLKLYQNWIKSTVKLEKIWAKTLLKLT